MRRTWIAIGVSVFALAAAGCGPDEGLKGEDYANQVQSILDKKYPPYPHTGASCSNYESWVDPAYDLTLADGSTVTVTECDWWPASTNGEQTGGWFYLKDGRLHQAPRGSSF